jgi:glutamate/tyrosine decarboxylase-like PLP-dependent enzyme
MSQPVAKGLSLWLMPEGDVREDLAVLIDRVTARLGTVPFAPHVTLLSGLAGPEAEVLDRARILAADLRPLPLAFSGIDGTDAHFRCLFLRVVATAALWEAHALAARHFGREPEEDFDPHLSLAYGTLDAGHKAALKRELHPETPPAFDASRLHVWRTDGPVGDWRELAVVELGSGAAVEPSRESTSRGLTRRHVPLEMSSEEFRQAGHRLVDDISGFIESLPTRPVAGDDSPRAVRSLLPTGLPEAGAPAPGLLAEAASLLFEHSTFNGHPRFFGYITSSAAPIGALADLLAAAVNPNVGAWPLSPAASEIEGQCIRWIAGLLGMPHDTEGLLVSGGNTANFVGFLAARRAKGGEALREEGLPGEGGRLLVYASTETHTWIQKAADLFGHGTASIRWIPVRGDLTIAEDALRRQIEADRAAGHRPFLLVGNAGTVSTGAVDPLPRLVAVAREHDLWLHVDGAYGALAVLSEESSPDLEGMAEADSVAMDPHKWLYTALEAGCALVRHRGALRDAFSYAPPYYRFDGEEDETRTNYHELGLQNSRGFRALKVWLGLRQAGRAGYRRMIGDDIRLARELHRLVEAEPSLEALTQGLSISTFRYVPEDLRPGTRPTDDYLNDLNEELLQRLKAGGEVYLSNAVVNGIFALRACIVNFRTTLPDVAAIPAVVVRVGAEVDRALRPGASP